MIGLSVDIEKSSLSRNLFRKPVDSTLAIRNPSVADCSQKKARAAKDETPRGPAKIRRRERRVGVGDRCRSRQYFFAPSSRRRSLVLRGRLPPLHHVEIEPSAALGEEQTLRGRVAGRGVPVIAAGLKE